MAAMRPGTVHNTMPGHLRIAGQLVPSGGSVDVDDVDAIELPVGAYVQPSPEPELEPAGDPAPKRTRTTSGKAGTTEENTE